MSLAQRPETPLHYHFTGFVTVFICVYYRVCLKIFWLVVTMVGLSVSFIVCMFWCFVCLNFICIYVNDYIYIESNCFALWELIGAAQIKWNSWRNRVLKLLLELPVLHIACGYLLVQQSARFNKVKECNIKSICRQQLFFSFRGHQYSSDQMKILKNQSAPTTARIVSVAYRLWLPSWATECS